MFSGGIERERLHEIGGMTGGMVTGSMTHNLS